MLQKTDSNRQARKKKMKKNEVSKCNLAFYTLSSKTVISGEKKKLKGRKEGRTKCGKEERMKGKQEERKKKEKRQNSKGGKAVRDF